jgi:hypothetical protein
MFSISTARLAARRDTGSGVGMNSHRQLADLNPRRATKRLATFLMKASLLHNWR